MVTVWYCEVRSLKRRTCFVLFYSDSHQEYVKFDEYIQSHFHSILIVILAESSTVCEFAPEVVVSACNRF